MDKKTLREHICCIMIGAGIGFLVPVFNIQTIIGFFLFLIGLITYINSKVVSK